MRNHAASLTGQINYECKYQSKSMMEEVGYMDGYLDINASNKLELKLGLVADWIRE